MNVLTSYIVREVLKGAFVTIILLLTLFNLFTFSDELPDMTETYGLKEICYFIALLSPGIFCELVPASALLGSLFILGAMGNNRELIAMRAAGLSIFGIIKAVMLAGMVLVIASVLVGEFVVPITERLAKNLRLTAQHQELQINSDYDIWLREGKKFINVRQIIDDHHLVDINIYELNEQQHIQQTLHAESAVFLGSQQWDLSNIKTSVISTQQMQMSQQDHLLWYTSIAPNLLKSVAINPNYLTFVDLSHHIDFLKNNHQKSHAFELAFWARIANPLVILMMLLLSAPFIISVKRGVSVGERMMIGIAIGMGFNIVDKVVGHLGLIYGLNPPLIAFIPCVTMLLLALYSVNRMRN